MTNSLHKHFDVSIDPQDKESLLSIIRSIRSDWNEKDVNFKEFTGTSNKVVGCFQKENEEIILFRIFGKNSELMVNHDREINNMTLLHKHGLASEIICTFNSGYCHQYIHGKVLTVTDMQDEMLAKHCAKLMAKLHCVPFTDSPCLFATIEHYLALVEKSLADVKNDRSWSKDLPSLDELCEEVQELKRVVAGHTNQDIVLCHNDISSANLVFNETTDSLHLLDFEFSFAGYAGFDIGNYFAEFGGVFGDDYSCYPDEKFQKWWIKLYLLELYSLRGNKSSVNEDVVHNVYVEVNHFTLVSHLFWAMWAILQSQVSAIDYDYVGYAGNRISEYKRKKQRFLSLK